MTYQATILARSPTLYVPFTETAGTSASDVTGNGHSATGSAPFACGATDGPICTEKAAEMGGNSDGFILANPASIPGAGGYTGGAFSLEYWAKYVSLDLSSVDGFAFLLSGTLGKVFQTQDFLANNYKLWAHEHISSSTPDGNILSAACLDALQCWHHLVFTWDGSASAIYRDGVLLAQGTSRGGSPFGATYADLFGQAFSPTFASMSGTDADHGYINHLAVYPVALSAADVAANYAAATPRCDGDCFAPLAWLRLRHSSGKSHIQQNGDAVQVRAGTVDVLHLPLPVLSATPTMLMGQDAATGLPAFCPPPAVVEITPAAKAPPTPPAVDPNQFRCGIAQYLTAQMGTAYNVASAKITSLNTTENTLVALGGPLASAILGLLDVVFPPLLIVTAFAIPFIVLLANYQETAALQPLGGPALDAIARSLYCTLQQNAAGLYEINGTTLFNWSYNLTNFGTSFSGNQLAEVRLLITVYQEEYWHNLALQADQQGSTLCAGYDCTGLLP